MEHLETILSKSEMRLLHLLVSGLKLRVRVGKNLVEYILTNIVVVQSDCLSAILFIFYLAMSIIPFPKITCAEDHAGEEMWSTLDWLVRKDVRNIQINPKYSDDISFIRSQLAKINCIMRVAPDMLREVDLIGNSSKREEYEVSRSGNENWKSCKYLGSLLDSEKDIGRRKCLALDAVTTLNHQFKSRNLS